MGGLFSRGLIYLFLWGVGGGYYLNFTVFDKDDFLLPTQKAGLFLASQLKTPTEDAESHEASTDKEIQELTDAVMKTFSLENPVMYESVTVDR